MKKIEGEYKGMQEWRSLFACRRPSGHGRGRRGRVRLTGAVLGDTLGAFRDGMLAKLAGKDQPDSSLDLAGRDL
jgi:hypothetical protein